MQVFLTKVLHTLLFSFSQLSSVVVFVCRSVPIVGTDLTNTEPNGPLYLSDGTMGFNTQVCET